LPGRIGTYRERKHKGEFGVRFATDELEAKKQFATITTRRTHGLIGYVMPFGSIVLADISSVDWSLKLDAAGEPGSGIGYVVQGLTDVNQCIQIILTTPKGSDPLRPTFGADVWRYIDAPINAAIPAIVREVTEAITRWEPRVIVISIRATPVTGTETQAGAHLEVAVTWRLKLTALGPGASPFAPTQSIVIAIPRV
jgi:phage baseplate assembly protein W